MKYAVNYIICAVLVTTSSLGTLFILGRWIYFHVTNKNTPFFQQLDMKITISHYSSIILFTLVPLLYSVQLYRKLIFHVDNDSIDTLFSTDIDQELIYKEEPELQEYVFLVMFCYFVGKYLSYFIIYLRLKQMLHDSIFSYDSKTYKKLLFLLAMHGISIVLMMTLTSIDNQYVYLGRSLFWISSDMIYFISISKMYLSKLKEIRNTYRNFIVATSRSNSGTNSPRAKDTTIRIPTRSASVTRFEENGDNGNKSNRQENGYRSDSSETTQTKKAQPFETTQTTQIDQTGQTTEGASNSVAGGVTSSKIYGKNKAAFESLSNVVQIYTRLSFAIFFSSFGFFIAISIVDVLFGVLTVGLLLTQIDCFINTFCLVLYFEQERKFYIKCKNCWK